MASHYVHSKSTQCKHVFTSVVYIFHKFIIFPPSINLVSPKIKGHAVVNLNIFLLVVINFDLEALKQRLLRIPTVDLMVGNLKINNYTDNLKLKCCKFLYPYLAESWSDPVQK